MAPGRSVYGPSARLAIWRRPAKVSTTFVPSRWMVRFGPAACVGDGAESSRQRKRGKAFLLIPVRGCLCRSLCGKGVSGVKVIDGKNENDGKSGTDRTRMPLQWVRHGVRRGRTGGEAKAVSLPPHSITDYLILGRLTWRRRSRSMSARKRSRSSALSFSEWTRCRCAG